MVLRNFLTSLSIEFGPVTLFFIGALVFNFFVGVALLMAATLLSILV